MNLLPVLPCSIWVGILVVLSKVRVHQQHTNDEERADDTTTNPSPVLIKPLT